MSCFQAEGGRLGDASLRCHAGDAELRLHGRHRACTDHTGQGNKELLYQQYLTEAKTSNTFRPPVSNMSFHNLQIEQIHLQTHFIVR